MKNLYLKILHKSHLAHYWPQCEPLLDKGLGDSEGELAAEHLLPLIERQQARLILGVDSTDRVHIAIALQFQKYPNYTVAHIYSVGGRGALHNRQHWGAIRDWMKEQGANKVQGSCKPAQVRLWRLLGLTPVYTIVRQDL